MSDSVEDRQGWIGWACTVSHSNNWKVKVNTKTIVSGLFLSSAFCLSIPINAYESFQGPTELIQYDPAKAFESYTLFSPFHGKNTYLLDMHGEVVHMWPYPEGISAPGREVVEKHARLLEDGTLLRGISDRSQGNTTNVIYQRVNWDGDVIWEYDETRPEYTPHHDFRMIWNPKLQEHTLLYVATRRISHEDGLALGLDPKLHDNYASEPDGLVEVDMDGNLIWEWNISDHLIQSLNPDALNYGVVSENLGKFDPNYGLGAGGDWIHINAFDYNQDLGQIAISSSSVSEIHIIDHDATFVAGNPERSIELAASDAGDFVYRWGNPCVSDTGDCPAMLKDGLVSYNGHAQLFFLHDVQWIRDKELVSPSASNLPGAGNILVFNNGSKQPGATFSSVIEFNPYAGDMADGEYVDQMEAGYNEPSGRGEGRGVSNTNVSSQIVWEYKSTMTTSFYSDYISGAQRLANGNTFIDSGANGHFFEVTPEGEVVWEYINPVGDRTGDNYGIYTIMTDSAGRTFNSVFRATRYAPDYSGLAGRDLVPMGQITEVHTSEASRPDR